MLHIMDNGEILIHRMKQNCSQASSRSFLGMKSGKGNKCDVREGNKGNPECDSGETCVPLYMHKGQCQTGNIFLP